MTDQGSYVLALLAIISGLAISAMVASLHSLIVSTTKVRWDWLLLTVAALVALNVIGGWWTSWRALHDIGADIALWRFVLILGQLVALYLAARSALPDVAGLKAIDLAAYYAAQQRHIWSNFVILYALMIVTSLIEFGVGRAGAAASASFLLGLVIALALWTIRSRRVHAIVVPVMFVLTAAITLPMPLRG